MSTTIGIITGSGTHALPDFDGGPPELIATEWGEAEVSCGRFAGSEVVHLSRHGEGHVRLSNHVTHRANVAALARAGAEAVIAVTVCGGVDPQLELGSLICFDDLHFPVNRLPDGSLCTFFNEPGDRRRGHWIYANPYSPALRKGLLGGARDAGLVMRDGGCYGHVDGPRFNTKAEIRGLAACGVTAVSQTAGPETVLAGELELPFALLGFVTDYANGVADEPTPVETLVEMMGRSTQAFGSVIASALGRIEGAELGGAGVVYRFGSD
ncbi:MAG: MTAP family purine nucleoside phosphorylase [Solirubrobacterales bacterium]|nr:MTAP family purine nucleoside phosphorylase [Solirubrobacterales bacterium]